MFVGRIDFSNLPALNTSSQPTQAEYDLLNRYFAKGHAYRNKTTVIEGRGIGLGVNNLAQFDWGTAGILFENAFRCLGPLYGLGFDKFAYGDPYHQKTDSYLWGFLFGSTGQPDRISNGQPDDSPDPEIGFYLEHTNSQVADGDAKIGFYALIASYIGDAYVTNGFMRATLAATNYGLAAVWICINNPPSSTALEGTKWQFHSTSIGDVIGSGLTQTINNGRINSDDVLTMLAIFGDPTLRTHLIAPVQIQSGSQNGTSVTLSWTPGESGCQFYVYEAPSRGGPYSRPTNGTWPTSSTSVTFTATAGWTNFMVRATKNVTTGSATYENLSPGAFWP